jgi:hypothetical protein
MSLFDDLIGEQFGATPVYDSLSDVFSGRSRGTQASMAAAGQDFGGNILGNIFGRGATKGTPTVADIELAREQMGQPGISRSFPQWLGSLVPGLNLRTETDPISGATRDAGSFNPGELVGGVLGASLGYLGVPALAGAIGGPGATFIPPGPTVLRGLAAAAGGKAGESLFPENEFYSKETYPGAQFIQSVVEAGKVAEERPGPLYGLAEAMQGRPSPAALNQRVPDPGGMGRQGNIAPSVGRPGQWLETSPQREQPTSVIGDPRFDLEYQRQGFAPLEDQRVGRQQLLQSYRDNMPPPERQVLPPITATPPVAGPPPPPPITTTPPPVAAPPPTDVAFKDVPVSRLDREQLQGAMAKLEGFGKKGAIPTTHNNPGSLKFADQPGAVEGERGFAKFETVEAGRAAHMRQIELDASRGLTMEEFLQKYAPDDWENYRKFLEKQDIPRY